MQGGGTRNELTLVGLAIAVSPFVVGLVLYFTREAFDLMQMAYIMAISLIGDSVAVYFIATHLRPEKRESFVRGVRTGILLVVLCAFALLVSELMR